ncbi:CHAP domain-containing protein [Paenibacillus sp. MER 99-2]|uniref:CHAP domain-containing protein n=1 Tax=Paenibacillus sp. MER 99-2 TaxID=2939572 RepID=UPI00203ACA87|nr:CHAP domain-containing protein [Paenibacillus sp. MER 99-2]MCM3172140.1 CHAP domain-containing protein [Paenibacillus sp. MER 99-2]
MDIITSRMNQIRTLVNDMILNMDSPIRQQEASVRLYGVSSYAAILALKRGLETEISAIAGLLHQFYYYKTGIAHYPGVNSADTLRPLLRDLQIFSKEEQRRILRAIFYQEQLKQVNEPYDEIIKDAIILQAYVQHINQPVPQAFAQRLVNTLNELSISVDHTEIDEIAATDSCTHSDFIDKRQKLAKIAEELAGQVIVGIPGDQRYREICQYWPDPDIHKVLQGNWCAAFVYHCCMLSGIFLPIRYPNADYRLAGVGALLEWSQLPETGFFHHDQDHNFTPERGDIVIYEKLLSDDSHDHVGIVLELYDDVILVAEGNKDNKNYSGIVSRNRNHCILGYIRIDNEYLYSFNGMYDPIL